MDITLNSHEEFGHAVLEVAGEVDVYTVPTPRDRIADLLDGGQRGLVVDLAGVEFIDSAGLGVPGWALNRAKELGGGPELVCPQERVLNLLRITGLDDVFAVHSSVEDAAHGTKAG